MKGLAADSGCSRSWLAAATIWYGFVGWLRANGRQEPRFALPIIFLVPGAWFLYQGFGTPQVSEPATDLINKGLGVVLTALGLRAFFARTSTAPRRHWN